MDRRAERSKVSDKKHSKKESPNKGKGGGKKSANEPVNRENLESACATFSCTANDIISFTTADPLNTDNKVTGFLCKKDGPFVGSVMITEINGEEVLPPQLIWGTPKVLSPFEDDESEERKFRKFPECASYVLTNKWNGTNVTFFKYKSNDGDWYVSIKPRMTPFLTDGPTGKFLTVIHKFLQLPVTLPLSNKLPSLLHHLQDQNVQSVTFELCGNEVPHLVKYDFEVALEPLFLTYNDGKIQPIINKDKTTSFNLPTEISCSQQELEKLLVKYQQDSLEANEKYRKEKGLQPSYWFDHFIEEGRVLYLVNENKCLIDRESMYKIKPKDIELYHWEQFDSQVQSKVLLAIKSLYEKEKEPTEENMQSELDMSKSQWTKWSRDVMQLVAGTPNPNRVVKLMVPQVLIMVGVPGSGKSTIANELVQMGWERVNQDELGTRRVCEARFENALQRGKSVVVDRCNFDISQRHTWIQLAAKYKVSTVRALSLDIDPEICKKRIFVRKDHPTISSGSSEGAKIIDRFKKTLVWPKEVEGFVEITTVHTEEEEKDIAKKYSLEGLEQDPNFKQLKGKNK